MDVKYLVSDHRQMHERALSLYFNPNVTFFHTFSVNNQNIYLSADFCVLHMFSLDSNMFFNP